MRNHRQEHDKIAKLLNIMKQLRTPETGCPWDLAQTFASIAPYTIEEAYEVADAIERKDMNNLREELGDLLFQVVFHTRMAEEAQVFDFYDVVNDLNEKMIRRHPHVFSIANGTEQKIETAEDQIKAWEFQKAQERHEKAAKNNISSSALDGVMLALPALSRAIKLQNRAARVGFDWPSLAPVFDKLQEEWQELRQALEANEDKKRLAEELGDMLFVMANIARHLDIDPEDALRGTNAKFESRFRKIEQALVEKGKKPQDSSLEEMDALWNEAKLQEKT